jgi:hypothetical protein
MEHLVRINLLLPKVGEDGFYAVVGPEVDPCETCGIRMPVPVAASPEEASAEDLKNAFLTIFREKMLAEIMVWNTLAKNVKEEEAAPGDASVSAGDIIEFLKKKQDVSLVTKSGQAVRPPSDKEDS